MKIKKLIWLGIVMPIGAFAQNLGTTQGNSMEINSIEGKSFSNTLRNKSWVYRDENGDNWHTMRLHDGISIDGSYLTPKVDTKTWWERDPHDDMQIWGNGANTYMVLKQGKLGIGTVPVYKLSVNSTASAPTLPDLANSITVGTKNANANNKYLGQIGFVSDDEDFTSPKMVAYISGEAAETYSGDTKTASIMRFYTGSSNGTNPVERMVINHQGFVGIGTTAPTEKLSVKGKIRAQEIKVELDNWADFVFDKDYKLPTLEETEAHIKEKGHLPDIPSAAEVAKNGVELGEMNKKLLQKVEEMTLYLIEIKKVNDVQQTQIKAQDEKIRQLSEQISKNKSIQPKNPQSHEH